MGLGKVSCGNDYHHSRYTQHCEHEFSLTLNLHLNFQYPAAAGMVLGCLLQGQQATLKGVVATTACSNIVSKKSISFTGISIVVVNFTSRPQTNFSRTSCLLDDIRRL
ncbi:hypothetical protein BASA83_011753 [Batrachochytrium salamandrivorans]|nr:hypothetical protein BASA83_011753 [Batrachochytrium salamandrivorans]